MTYKQYKLIDLAIFSLLIILSEFLAEYGGNLLNTTTIYMSFSILITVIAIYRWGFIGVLVLTIGSFAAVFLSNIEQLDILQKILYFVGSSLSLFLIPLIAKAVKKKDGMSPPIIEFILVLLLSIILVVITKIIILTIITKSSFHANFIEHVVRYIFVFATSLVGGIILKVITKDRLIVNMKKRLLKLQGEKKNER